MKGVTETIENKTKWTKRWTFCTFLGTLGPSLLGNHLRGEGVFQAGKGATRASQGRQGKIGAG